MLRRKGLSSTNRMRRARSSSPKATWVSVLNQFASPFDRLYEMATRLRTAGAEEDDVLGALASFFLDLGGRLVFPLLDRDVGERRDAVRIQDHDDAAVTEDRIAGIDAEIAQQRRHRLHHDFFGVEH